MVRGTGYDWNGGVEHCEDCTDVHGVWQLDWLGLDVTPGSCSSFSNSPIPTKNRRVSC